MARVKYIGTKPHGRVDTVAGTGVVWSEPGDVQEVTEPKAVVLLLRHKDVWQLETPIAIAPVAAKPAELPLSTEPAETKPAKPAKAEAPADPAPAKGKGGKKKLEPPAEPKYELEGENGATFVLDTMDDAQLAAFAKDFGIEVAAELTGDALRAELFKAATKE
jgi:hypothetical protein